MKLKYCISLVLGACVYSYACAQDRLIFAIDIVRHGDRTPVIASPQMAKIWSQGAGQLTPTGMRQTFELGKLLRQRYVNELHLLAKQYDIKAMQVRSSCLPRTMMSAQSILAGLYPLGTGPSLANGSKALPQGLQPIPVDTVPCGQDDLLVPYHDKMMYQKLLDTYVLNTPAWLAQDAQLKPYYAEWSKLFAVDIHSLLDLIALRDRLWIEHIYGLAPPLGMPPTEVDMIMTAGKWAMLHIANHTNFALYAGRTLAQTIKEELNAAATEDRPLKYLLFVAHDTTLAAQLKLLDQTIDDIPPYAAVLNYSLFDLGAANYEVRVSYNQQPLYITHCGGFHCRLEDFVKLIDEQITPIPVSM